ncbi:MAG: ferric reductase-like transmembrane domain-containing protein [Solirubrobacterales bacterium]
MIAAAGPSALWYLSRGAGATALVGLTATVVLGIVHADRRRPARAPRMLVESAHRTISLLVLALLAVHIATAVLDPFAPIRLADAVVPFASAYRPLWLGLGALAFDVLAAVAITSALRLRLGARAWRAVHWLAYACWPLAVVHGLGTGTDARQTWLLALTAACVVAPAAALAVRLAGAGPQRRAVRGAAAATLVLALVALPVWLAQGPLARGWARRAGTPPALLATAAVARPSRVPAFSTAIAGTEHDGRSADGRVVVDLALRLHDGGDLRVRLAGDPIPGGGVAMGTSAVTLVRHTTYQGRIERLRGNVVDSVVAAADGRTLRLRLVLDLGGGTVGGQLTGQPLGASS